MVEGKYYNRVDYLENKISRLENKNVELNKEINFLKYLLLKEEDNSEDYCPICGNFSKFRNYGVPPRPHEECPHCFSLARHRQVYLLLKQNFDDLLFKNNIKLLHFAPELSFYNLFSKYKNIDYFPVDFVPEIYETNNVHIRDKVDMADIPYRDNTFDFIYNCHVLEHVPDDIKAMGELYRVLKKDGVCITLSPVSPDIYTTIEDKSINTPELRLKHYGQSDHVRIYGLDFKERLESVGFNVKETYSFNVLNSEKERELYRIAYDRVYVCTKK